MVLLPGDPSTAMEAVLIAAAISMRETDEMTEEGILPASGHLAPGVADNTIYEGR